ncbi:MAG: NAD(P)H-hydrate epimerase, partial [Thermotogota bacterium]|nr:NAD(P)H-hydrate epimerase [Thermotogota bacterium]
MIVTPSEMRVLEQAAITQEGVPSLRLMENAGMAVVKHYLDSLSKNANGLEKPVLILCGKGNNAGDGMVVARELHTRQVPVHTAFCMGRDFTGDAETEYQRLMASQAPTFDLAEPSSMR